MAKKKKEGHIIRYKKEERRKRYKESESNSFEVPNELFTTLPQDIQDFLNSEIPDKNKYNKLCLRYHPDKGGDEEMFKIINNHMNP